MNNADLRIAIAGSFGYRDIGDEAMLTEDLHFIKHSLGIPAEQILLLANDVDYVSRYHQHPKSQCESSEKIEHNWWHFLRKQRRFYPVLKSLRQALNRPYPDHYPDLHRRVQDCQAALITGGGTINTRDGRGYSIRRMHRLVSYFSSCGLKIFMSGQTIGPLGIDPEHDLLAKDILSKVDFLTVRDQLHSRQNLELIGCRPKNFFETFDDAYSLPFDDEVLPEYVEEFFNNAATVAINASEYTGSLPDHRIFVAELCRHYLEERGLQVALVSHTPDDFQNLQAIVEIIPEYLKESLILPDTREWSASMLKKLISRCILAIGARYHFIVFAATSNVPFIGMCGNEYSFIKQEGFASQLELQDFILNTTDTWNMAHLLSRAHQAEKLKLSLSERFSRPSKSMVLFSDWLASVVHSDH